jgi:putative transposase
MVKVIKKKTAERRRYTAEYRREALLLADKVGVAVAAKQLGLHESQLYNWRGKDRLERSQSEVEKQQALEIVRLKRQLAEKTEDLAILKKRQRTLPRGVEEAATAKYAFMIEVRGEFTVTAMCRTLEVSPSAFHAWRHRRDQGRNHGAGHPAMDALVSAAFHAEKGRSGSPRLTLDLAGAGHRHDRKTVGKCMNRLGLRAKGARKFKVTTDSGHGKPTAPNLLNREFYAAAPNLKWVGDITYLHTDEGWLYLATVMDLYSRKVVGWAMSDRMKAELACDALTMALWRRGFPKGVLVHTDRGSQYCSDKYQDLLVKHKLVCSMSGTGNCYDNACAESFFHTLKVELIHGERFNKRSDMRAAVFEYIELDYNRRRRHSAIGMVSPEAFEAQRVA